MKTFTDKTKYKKKNMKLSPIANFFMQILTSFLSSGATIVSFGLLFVNVMSLLITFS